MRTGITDSHKPKNKAGERIQMSVREVNGKFVGLRVERSIDKLPYIKFFSYRIRVLENGITKFRNATRAEKRELLAAAEAYDKKLERLQKNLSKENSSLSIAEPIQGSREFRTDRAEIPRVMNIWVSSSTSP